jgi:hypothetical protein
MGLGTSIGKGHDTCGPTPLLFPPILFVFVGFHCMRFLAKFHCMRFLGNAANITIWRFMRVATTRSTYDFLF